MNHYTREDVMRMIEEEDVEFIRLQFTDFHGTLKNMAVTSAQIERILDNGAFFDMSAIDKVVDPNSSERMLIPDFNTFEIFPWRPQQGKVARLLCNIAYPDGTYSKGDSKSILRSISDEAAKDGYELQVGPKCEFFLFETDENGNPTVITHEQATYFDLGPLDEGENARRDIVMNLEDMGFSIDASHHESAPAQHEIDLSFGEVNEMANNVQTFKLAVRTIAKRHGLHATFMPKPKDNVSGSGMHLDLQLFKDGKNVFGDANDENGLSKEAYWFIGGLLKHIPAMTAITNPLVNSYKRLTPGYEAPVYVAWSRNNRNQLVRVPSVSDVSNTKIELRSPDPSANPYLTFALCLAAGMDGIKNQIEPPIPVEEDITAMSTAEISRRGIVRLPETLAAAVEEFDKSDFIRKTIGDYATDKYVQGKTAEWNEYNHYVSSWELKEYLNRY